MSSAHISIAPSLSLPLVVPRQAEDFTRVRLILTDTDGDGVLDFVTNQISVMTTATKTADVVVTTTRADPEPSLESKSPTSLGPTPIDPFPTPSIVTVTMSPPPSTPSPTPTTFLTITLSSASSSSISPTSSTPTTTLTAAPIPLSPSASRTGMLIGIGATVGVVAVALATVYLCCGRSKNLPGSGALRALRKRNKRRQQKLDKGKGRAEPDGATGQDGASANQQLVGTVSSHGGGRSVELQRYHSPADDSNMMGRSGPALGSGSSPLLHPHPGPSYLAQESLAPVMRGALADRYSPAPSTPTKTSTVTTSSNRISTATYNSAAPLLPGSSPASPTTGSRDSYHHHGHHHHQRTSAMSSPRPPSSSPRQPRWTSFDGHGQVDGTALGRPPAEGSVVMSSLCGHDREDGDQPPIMTRNSGADRADAGSPRTHQSMRRESAESGMLNQVRHYRPGPIPSVYSTSTTTSNTGVPHDNDNDMYSESRYPSPSDFPSPPRGLPQTASSLPPTPPHSSAAGAAAAIPPTTPVRNPPQQQQHRPFSFSPDTQGHFHVSSRGTPPTTTTTTTTHAPPTSTSTSTPTLHSGPERTSSSVTLTIVPSPGTGAGRTSLTYDRVRPVSHSQSQSQSQQGSVSVRTTRASPGALGRESPLEVLVRVCLPGSGGGVYIEREEEGGEGADEVVDSDGRRGSMGGGRVREWIERGSRQWGWGDPEVGSVVSKNRGGAGGAGEEDADGEESGEEEEFWGGILGEGTVVAGDSVSRVGERRGGRG